MEKYAKIILKYLNNNHTKTEVKQDFNGNYYSFLTDTIYLAKKLESKKRQKELKEVNINASNFVVMCHECIHSIQSKTLHILNILFSNTSLIFTFALVVLCIINKKSLIFCIVTLSVILGAVVIRCILEIGAIKGSTKLATEIIQKENLKEISFNDINEAKEYINKHKLLALLDMNKDKIIMFIIILIIAII